MSRGATSEEVLIVGVLEEFALELVRAQSLHGDNHKLADWKPTELLLDLPIAESAKADLEWASREGNASWAGVLIEEVFEALDEAALGAVDNLREELVQVGAMALGWIQALDARRG